MMRRVVRMMAIIMSIISAIALASMLFLEIKEQKAMLVEGEKITKYVTRVEELVESVDVSSDTDSKLEEYQELERINEDFVGWIYSKEINYPVVQYSDNSYYLNHNFSKERSKFGAIFMDYRVNSDNDVILIHGHNTYNGSMFGSLKGYMNDRQYLDANKDYYIALDSNAYTFQHYTVGAVLVVDELHSLLNPSIVNLDEYKQILNNLLGESSNELKQSQKLIVLSTCYGSAGTDKRLLVVLIEDSSDSK